LPEEIRYTIEGISCKALASLKQGGTPIVFLHGLRFTSGVWEKAGILGKLDEDGIRYLAPDLPYGIYADCSNRTLSDDKVVGIVSGLVSKHLGGEAPILVGASIGGYYALRYALDNEVAGLVLVAPASRRIASLKGLDRLGSRTLIMWGDGDRIVGKDEIEGLSKALNTTRISVYEGAGHALYLDYPERFVEELISFYKDVARA